MLETVNMCMDNNGDSMGTFIAPVGQQIFSGLLQVSSSSYLSVNGMMIRRHVALCVRLASKNWIVLLPHY